MRGKTPSMVHDGISAGNCPRKNTVSKWATWWGKRDLNFKNVRFPVGIVSSFSQRGKTKGFTKISEYDPALITNQTIFARIQTVNGISPTARSFPRHGLPLHPLKARRVGPQISHFLNNRNRINGEVPPQRLLTEKTEIPSSISNKLEILN